MKKLLKKTGFYKDEEGATSIAFTASLTVLFVTTGAAIDLTRTHHYKQNLQNSLDASTLFAAQNRINDNFETESQKLFDNNFNAPNASEFIDNYSLGSDEESLEGFASGDLKLIFGGILGHRTIPISAKSVVNFSSEEIETCIAALEQGRNGIQFNSGAIITAPTCSIGAHATQNPAISINNDLTLDVSEICVAGSNITNNNPTIDNIRTGCEVEADPYQGAFPVPDSSGCDYNSQNFNGTEIILDPGVYCGNFNFNNGNANVTFTGGEQPYILRGGSWNVNGGEWTGDNVSFYFADSQAKIQFNSGVKATLTPPSSGPYAGVFMTEAPGLENRQITINDSRGFDFEGIVYLPSKEVTFNSGVTVRSRALSLVARSFIFNDVSLNIDQNAPGSILAGNDVFYIGG